METTTKIKWSKFPYDQSKFDYPKNKLKDNWDRLHAGDREPFPSADYLKKTAKNHPEAIKTAPNFNNDFEALSENLQEAWRLYHRGDFQQAAELGLSLGVLGYSVANKATYVYTTYFVEDKNQQLELYQTIMKRAEKAAQLIPDHANSHYFGASALGRYSQLISVAKAVTEGLAGKTKRMLDTALQIEPKNAEAHVASGLYHAEIIDKLGSMVGKLTYGAKKESGIEHFEKAMKNAPNSPIVYMEYANALLMLFGKKKVDEATEAYEKAANMKPVEAMEFLDMKLAQSELED